MKTIFLLLALLFATAQAHATTYWVSATGGSTGSVCADIDGSVDPTVYFRTIVAGIACLSSGDTLKIKDGTYTDDLDELGAPSGTSGSYTTIEGVNYGGAIINFPSQAVGLRVSNTRSWIYIKNLVLDGSANTSQTVKIDYSPSLTDGATNIVLDSLVIRNAGQTSLNVTAQNLSVTDYSEVTLKNSTIHSAYGSHNIYWRGRNGIIEHNDIYGCGEYDSDCYGLQLYSTIGGVNNNTVRYNMFRNNNKALLIAAGTGNVAHNNIFWNNNVGSDGAGIICTATGGAGSNKVYNNTIYGSDTAMIQFSGSCAADWINNLALGNTSNTITTSGANTTNRTSGTATDYMIDPANGNFALKESSSAIDAGTVISGFSAGRYVSSAPDQGAFEAPVRSSAVVEDTDKNTYLITFALPVQSTGGNGTAGTGLQGCTTANWTLRDDGAAKTESACNIVTTSKIGVDVSDGDFTTGVIDDAYARGTLTDNVCIGDPNTGCYNAYVINYSATAGTNNIGAAPSIALTQSRYRFHKLRGTEASPSLICTACSENVSISTPPGAAFRLRVKFRTDDDPAGTTYKLRYSKDGGSYTDIPDAFAADLIAWYGVTADTDIPSAGEATTELLTSDEASNLACAVVRSSSDYPILDFNNSETECEYVVKISTSATASTTYDFRVYKGDNTALDTYSVTPRLTVGNYVMGF